MRSNATQKERPPESEDERLAKAIAVLKGHTERLKLSPWTNNGRHYVSVSREWLQDGQYCFRRGGFALQPDEARELAAGLVAMADTVAAMPAPDEDEEGYLPGRSGRSNAKTRARAM